MRVLGRVERFRDRLQLDVRSLEAAEEDPAALAPAHAARRATSWTASSSSSPPRSRTRAWRRWSARSSPTRRCGPALRALPAAARTATTATRAACSSTRSASRRSAARRRSCTRGCGPTCCSRRRCCTTSAATRELGRGPAFAPTDEGRLLGHVHLGLRLVEERRRTALDATVRAELLHAIAGHHDARAARTAEALVLYHANQLDAVAATRPVGDDA